MYHKCITNEKIKSIFENLFKQCRIGKKILPMNKNKIRLAVVLPCYNEEEVLTQTIQNIEDIFNKLLKKELIDYGSFILFVDDGSNDNTWKIIFEKSKKNNFFKGLKLSKNEGHQHALLAGMHEVTHQCDCMISLDADLQQDPNAIFDMLEKFKEGYEIVLGVRDNRETDGFFKRVTAQNYYKLMKLMGVDLVANHADYRLMSNKALILLGMFKEKNIFLRGLVRLIGLKSTIITFQNRERFSGESKYTFRKMLTFAWNGISSFSVVPLKIITILGLLVFLLSLILGLYVLYSVLISQNAVPGWASTVLPMYLLGGVQLLSLGIIGEYLGKIYTEVKNRPSYFIEERTN